MIKAKDAITVARAQLGTTYGTGPGELDCINLIKKVIREAPGGVSGYTTAGTNTLWRSYDSSPKYRDLTTRQQGIDGAKPGMIAFKHSGSDYHHAGIVTERGTVIHASGPGGKYDKVVETPLTAAQGWTALAIHRHIEPDYDAKEETMDSYKARVDLENEKSSLNVRNGPSDKNRVIGSLRHGDVVNVQATPGAWAFITFGSGRMGYVAAEFLERVEGEAEVGSTATDEKTDGVVLTTLVCDDGRSFRIEGRWSIAED